MSGTRDKSPARAHAVEVVDAIRRMISSGELSPGESIRQESMAARLGVSRLPIREALRELAADGLLAHKPNVGYAVAKLSRGEFEEIYLMRRLLESEVLSRLPRPSADQLSEIRQLHAQIAAASEAMDLNEMYHLNRQFHFAFFQMSGLNRVNAEIERIWNVASPYHSVYLYSPESRSTVLIEHGAMIDALGDGDNERLVELMDEHRLGAEHQIAHVLRDSVAVV